MIDRAVSVRSEEGRLHIHVKYCKVEGSLRQKYVQLHSQSPIAIYPTLNDDDDVTKGERVVLVWRPAWPSSHVMINIVIQERRLITTYMQPIYILTLITTCKDEK